MAEPADGDALRLPVLTAFGAAFLEGTQPGRLRLCAEPPEWLRRLFGRELRAGDELEWGEDHPALAGFLNEAEQYWTRADTAPLASGVVEELDTEGEFHPLEAVALRTEETPRALVLRDLRGEFEVLQGRFQSARDSFLGYEQLRSEVEKKELLLHCIVHDLKGPLAGIVGHLSLLKSRPLTPERSREIAGKALEQARRQLDMIQLVLEVFSTELEQIESFETLRERAPDLRACVAEALASCEPAFSQREVELSARWSVDEEGPQLFVGQADRFVRVLVNLLENALRHAPVGSSVELTVHDEGERMLVRIEDRGAGVPAELVPHLFQRFGRDSSSGGMAGLGLYSARLTLERWGGAIGYEPREGGGACFWCAVPATFGSQAVDAHK